MLKRNWKKMLKSKGMVWTLLFCLAAGAVAGTIYKSSKSGEEGTQVASGNLEQETKSDDANTSGSDSVPAENSDQVYVKNDGTDENSGDQANAEDENGGENEENSGNSSADVVASNGKDTENAAGTQSGDNSQEAAPASTVIQAQNLDFLTNSTLSWPVEGEVLMEFNMDETIYFPTLNVYKCNQAMVIQAEEGTPVCAPAEGIVLSIGSDEQIGNYMVLDIGDGYQVEMGQLKDIQVKEGDLVNEGDLLAYVAAPTKCYSVEGDNLYLSLTANGEPVDPLDYLEY